MEKVLFREEVLLLKLKHAETELKFHKERIAVIVKEITEELSPEILEERSEMPSLKRKEIRKGWKLIHVIVS